MKSQKELKISENKYVFSGKYLLEYNLYSNELDNLNLASETKDWRLKHIRGFLFYLEQNHIKLENLESKDIYNYMYNIKDLSERTKEHRAVCIRFFLNYLFSKNFISFNGNMIFPKIKCNKKSKLLSFYSDDEISKIVNSINIDSINGKRDFAIIMLFVDLGMRLSDVRFLKLENISWLENQICYIQSKSKTINTLYMPDDVRYSLIDYLKNERPISNLEYVFLKDEKSIYDSHEFYNIVNKYITLSKININGRKHGPHSLRHSLATSIINKNNNLEIISSILGHDNLKDTSIYTHVNIKELRKLSLEVPEWKN